MKRRNNRHNRLLSILLTFVMLLALAPASVFAAEDQEAFDADYAALTMESILGNNADQDNIIKDMHFPESGANGTTITWKNDPWLFWGDGSLDVDELEWWLDKYGGEYVEVTIIATLQKGECNGTKNFIVKVRSADALGGDAADVAAAKKALIYAVIQNGNGNQNNVYKKLNLITETENGCAVVWQSSDEAHITTGGSVTRPAVGAGYAAVTLTATISKGAESDTVTFALRVLARTAALEQNEAAANNLTLGDTTELTRSLTLPRTQDGVNVSWASSDESVVTGSGEISRPDYGESARSATLTATLGSSTNAVTKDFAITVLPLSQTESGDKQDARTATEEVLALIPDPEDIEYETLDDAFARLEAAQDAIALAKAAGWTSANVTQFTGYSRIQAANDKIDTLPRDVTISILNAELQPGVDHPVYLENDILSPVKVKVPAGMRSQYVMNTLHDLAGFTMDPMEANYSYGALPGRKHYQNGEWVSDTGGTWRWMYLMDRESWDQFSSTVFRHNQTVTWAYTSFSNPGVIPFPDSKTGPGYDAPLDGPATYDLVDPTKNADDWLEGSMLLGDNPDFEHITSDMTLPDKAPNNVKIQWKSSNTEVIDDNGNLVNYYLLSGDKKVTLTATIKLEVYINYNTSNVYPEYTRTFDVRVIAPVMSTDEKSVSIAKDELTLGDTSLISGNIVLPQKGSLSTDISWESSDPLLVSNTGVISRPDYGQGNKTAVLTATISKNAVMAEKQFSVTVKEKETSGQAAVDFDLAELSFDVIKDRNTAENSISYNLELPSSGYQGSAIAWSSTPADRISPDGVVERPAPGESALDVTLTATLSKGGAQATKDFALTLVPMSNIEAKVAEAEKAFKPVPDAIDIWESTRDELQAKDKIYAATQAYEAAMDVGAAASDMPGYARVLESDAKMKRLPSYVNISITGDIDDDPDNDVYGYFHEPSRVRLAPRMSLMAATVMIAELDGTTVVRTFGGGFLDTMYKRSKCWTYQTRSNVLGSMSGAGGYMPDHDDAVWWVQVYTQKSVLDNLGDTRYKEPIDGPPTIDLWNETVDKAPLAALIAEAKDKDKADYRDYASWVNGWGDFQKAISYAERIIGVDDAIQYDLDEAYGALLDAMDTLEPLAADTTALDVLITEADTLDEQDYKDGWSEFVEALRLAKDASNSVFASRKEVNDADQRLSDAIRALTPADSAADKTALNSEITNAENLQMEAYTAISWSRLVTALNYAKYVQTTGAATQDEIDEALASLRKAISQLLPSSPSALNDKIAVAIETVGETFIGATDSWEIMDMAYAGRGNETAKAQYLEEAVVVIESDSSQPTDLQRTGIALTALGVDIGRIEDGSGKTYDLLGKIVNEERDLQVNALTFALLAVDSGKYRIPDGAKWTRAELVRALLDTQLSDNGWDWNKETTVADVDMTAMVISALAPYYTGAAETYGETIPSVTQAVDAAYTFLVSKQNSNATFGQGLNPGSVTGNTNSTAMSIIAALSLGKNPTTEFTKPINPSMPTMGRRHVLTALFDNFFTSKFLFGITDKVTFNRLATEQAFRALLAYDKFMGEGGAQSPYRFDAPTTGSIVDKTTLNAKIAELENLQQGEYPENRWAAFMEALSEAKEVADAPTLNQTQKTVDDAYAVLMTAYRTLDAADKIAPAILTTALNETVTLDNYAFTAYGEDDFDGRLTAVVTVNGNVLTGSGDAFAASLVEGQNFISITVTDYSGNSAEETFTVTYVPEPSVADVNITVTVEKFTVDGNYIVEPTRLTVKEGISVAEALDQLLKAKGIEYRNTGSIDELFYLSGVKDGEDWLNQFSHGSSSGWKYALNNVFPNVGASDRNVKDGDVIRWQYTRVGLGTDLDVQVDKDALTRKVAEINSLTDKAAWRAGDSGQNGRDYDAALIVLSTLSAPNAAVEAALAALNDESDYHAVIEKLYDAILSTSSLKADDYTEASWNNLTTLRSIALLVAAIPGASNDAINAAMQALNDAIASLVPAADKNSDGAVQSIADLAAVISVVVNLKETAYTVDSWAVLQDALIKANAVLAKKVATQPEIAAAQAALDNAVAGLKLKTGDVGIQQAGGSVVQQTGDKAAADIAQQPAATQTYKVTFNANGGKIGKAKTKAVTIEYGKSYGKLPTAKRAGDYKFKGWYTAKRGGEKITAKTKMSKQGKQTLYAQWKVRYGMLKANAFSVRVRAKANVKSKTRGYVPAAMEFRVIEKVDRRGTGNDWYKVKCLNTDDKVVTGYIHAKYITAYWR